MTMALPVRPVPATGEPLTSYAARLADANGLTRSRVLPSHRHDVGVPAGELATLAALAGLDIAAAAQLTMDRYPPTVRGQGATHRGGWRLHFSADWICPRCTPRTGRRELLWQTALSPMCRHCNVLLIPATAAPAAEVVDAARDLTVLVDELIDLAEPSITHHSARVRLGRFRRLCALIAQTIDDDWPHRHDALPPVDEAIARAWGAFPSADPATVATILVSAGPALHSTAFHDQLSREGHARRRGTPTRHPRKYLPQRPPAPPRRPIVAGFNATDSGRLRWLLTQLEHQAVRHGIRPEHVPALLPHPDDDGLPDPADWRTRWHAALALHMLLTQTHEGSPSSSRAALAFGTADTDSSRLLDGVRLGRGISHTDAHFLGDAVTVLLNDGLIDYQRRRDILRPINTLPRLPVPASNLPEIDGYAPRVLALGWIWTRLTRGPMWTSPFPLVPDRHVRTFNAAIDPETRLVLDETGQQFLADADLLTIPANRHLRRHHPEVRMSHLEPDHEDLHTRAARILQAMADTPIPAMDATFYAHYVEELRMLVEELLAGGPPMPASVTRVWLVWNCHDIAGCYSTEHAALEARADLQHQLLCQFGPDADLLESITITTAHVPTQCLGSHRSHR